MIEVLMLAVLALLWLELEDATYDVGMWQWVDVYVEGGARALFIGGNKMVATNMILKAMFVRDVWQNNNVRQQQT